MPRNKDLKNLQANRSVGAHTQCLVEPRISNSAVYDSTEERRPVAVNKRQVRPKPIPINKASLAMELLNNQTRPTVNIVGTRHFHENPTPLDKNFPIEIELQRIAMEAVPNKPQQPLKIKSAITDEMIEKYREEERRGILQRGYNVPPELDVLDLEEDTPSQRLPRIQEILTEGASVKRELLQKYNDLQKEMDVLQKQKVTSGFSLDRPISVDTLGKYTIPKEKRLGEISREMKNIQSQLSTTNEEIDNMLEVKKTFEVEGERIKRANAQKIKNAEDQLRLLNTTLPISQMVGEPDEVYRQRLIALRVPVDNSRVDAQEARIYEHKLFKRNLKKLIDLPLYQVENIIKMLDLNDMERTYQLNEIFPKVETEFIKVFGRKPFLRDPVQSLVDFFTSILEAPLVAQEQSEALSALTEQQSVSTGDIDPRLKGMKKAEVLKLLKEAGLTKGRAAEFQKKTVNNLKIIYTEHLKQTRSLPDQAQAEAFGFLSQLGQTQKKKQVEANKVRMDRLMARLLEDEKEMLRQEKETERMMKQQEKQQEKSEREMMGEEEKQTRKLMRQPKKDKGQQGIAKFMSKQAAKK